MICWVAAWNSKMGYKHTKDKLTLYDKRFLAINEKITQYTSFSYRLFPWTESLADRITKASWYSCRQIFKSVGNLNYQFSFEVSIQVLEI